MLPKGFDLENVPVARIKPVKGTKEAIYSAGTRVCLTDLTTRADLNGRTAVCLSYDRSSGRYTIELDDSCSQQLSLRPKNLVIVTTTSTKRRPKGPSGDSPKAFSPSELDKEPSSDKASMVDAQKPSILPENDDQQGHQTTMRDAHDRPYHRPKHDGQRQNTQKMHDVREMLVSRGSAHHLPLQQSSSDDDEEEGHDGAHGCMIRTATHHRRKARSHRRAVGHRKGDRSIIAAAFSSVWFPP